MSEINSIIFSSTSRPNARQDRLKRVKASPSTSIAPTSPKSENRSETETEYSLTASEVMRSDHMRGRSYRYQGSHSNGIPEDGIPALYRSSGTQYNEICLDKDRKPFCTDLNTIYHAPNEGKAFESLNRVTEKWNGKYPNSMKSWKQNWDAISPIFKFSAAVRQIIYTTNAIESQRYIPQVQPPEKRLSE